MQGDGYDADQEASGSLLDAKSEGSQLKTVFWPQDLLPGIITESRIYTWGYDVDINHVFSSASQATVFQHSSTLLSDLADERTSEESVSSCILVKRS